MNIQKRTHKLYVKRTIGSNASVIAHSSFENYPGNSV